MAKSKDLGSMVFGHAVAFLFLVLFPAIFTAMAPVSWIRFERSGDKVVAHVRVCTLFVVPYLTKTVDPVVGIGDEFSPGEMSTSNRPGQRRVRTEDEAYLVIHGPAEPVSVPVTPFNIDSVTERAQAFVADPQSTELRMTVVANWKFSVIGGGIVSLLTVLYLLMIVSSVFRTVRRWLGFAPAE